MVVVEGVREGGGEAQSWGGGDEPVRTLTLISLELHESE